MKILFMMSAIAVFYFILGAWFGRTILGPSNTKKVTK